MVPVTRRQIGGILQFSHIYKELDRSTDISIMLNLVSLEVPKGSWPSKVTCRQT